MLPPEYTRFHVREASKPRRENASVKCEETREVGKIKDAPSEDARNKRWNQPDPFWRFIV